MRTPLVPYDLLVEQNEMSQNEDLQDALGVSPEINVTEVERVGRGMLMHVGEQKLYITGDECVALMRWLVKEFPIEALGALA